MATVQATGVKMLILVLCVVISLNVIAWSLLQTSIEIGPHFIAEEHNTSALFVTAAPSNISSERTHQIHEVPNVQVETTTIVVTTKTTTIITTTTTTTTIITTTTSINDMSEKTPAFQSKVTSAKHLSNESNPPKILIKPRERAQNLSKSSYLPNKGREVWNNPDLFLKILQKDLDKELLNYGMSREERNSLAIGKGGQPKRTWILTTWRSGSTFLGELLSEHAGTYFLYEPLCNFGIKQIRYGDQAKLAIKQLKSLLQCDFERQVGYLSYGKQNFDLHLHNSRVWKYCLHGSNQICYDGRFLSRSCKIYPFQTIKTVRMRVNLTEPFLKEKRWNMKILVLVRDPRAILQSRKHRFWCHHQPDCDESQNLCSDMVSDYKAAKKLSAKFPGKIRVVRYEDFMVNVSSNSMEILDHYGFKTTDRISRYISQHSINAKNNVDLSHQPQWNGRSSNNQVIKNSPKDLQKNLASRAKEDPLLQKFRHFRKSAQFQPWSTIRDSKNVTSHWKNELSFTEITEIQNNCKLAMKLWGYRRFDTPEELHMLDPVLKWDW